MHILREDIHRKSQDLIRERQSPYIKCQDRQQKVQSICCLPKVQRTSIEGIVKNADGTGLTVFFHKQNTLYGTSSHSYALKVHFMFMSYFLDVLISSCLPNSSHFQLPIVTWKLFLLLGWAQAVLESLSSHGLQTCPLRQNANIAI